MGREPAEILTARISVRPTEPHLTRPVKTIYPTRTRCAIMLFKGWWAVWETYSQPSLRGPAEQVWGLRWIDSRSAGQAYRGDDNYQGQRISLTPSERRAHCWPRRLGDSFRAGRKTPGGEAGLGVGGETQRAPLVGRLCCC